MARISVPRWSVYVVVAALIASLSFSFGSLYSAFGTSHDTTYYACLYAGSLSQVGTTPPVNCGRGAQISWNSEGVQGPIGEQGPIGPQGEQGPIGPQGPAGATNVVVRQNQIEVPANSTYGSSANCDEGEVATGGGFSFVSDTLKAMYSGPNMDLNDVPTGWFARLLNPNNTTSYGTVYAICASP